MKKDDHEETPSPGPLVGALSFVAGVGAFVFFAVLYFSGMTVFN